MYTLSAAAAGRRVVALGANVENLKRLHVTLTENHLDQLVTLVLNALYDRRGVNMRIASPLGNIGGGTLVTEESRLKYFGEDQRGFSLRRMGDNGGPQFVDPGKLGIFVGIMGSLNVKYINSLRRLQW